MNESVLVELTRGGQQVTIDRVSHDGIVLSGETSAWPRRTCLQFEPVSPGTRERLKLIRRQKGWHPREMRLKYRARQGCLQLTGVDRYSLPPGTWQLRLNIYDLRRSRQHRIHIPTDGQCRIKIPARNDSGGRIQVAPTQQLDPYISRVLEASTLDGMPGLRWIADNRPRTKRRACVMNILAVCRELHLIERIRRVVFAEVDRLYADIDPGFSALLTQNFRPEGVPQHPIHSRLLDTLPAGQRKNYILEGFRQLRTPSLQVVVARPRNGPGIFVAEMDIDRGNIRDPLGFIIHTGEVLHPGRTNHLRLRAKLAATGAGPFLAYAV